MGIEQYYVDGLVTTKELYEKATCGEVHKADDVFTPGTKAYFIAHASPKQLFKRAMKELDELS